MKKQCHVSEKKRKKYKEDPNRKLELETTITEKFSGWTQWQNKRDRRKNQCTER